MMTQRPFPPTLIRARAARRPAVLVLTLLGLGFLPAAPSIADPSEAARPGAAVRIDDLPPGLQAARLLPGWIDADGHRVLALELQLEPGWKTYWRSPGDTGLPPHFTWEGSENLADVTFHWPAPEAIRSGDTVEMGYHDSLILPFTVSAQDTDRPMDIRMQVDLGLCEAICVPARLELAAASPQSQSSAEILEAIDAAPRRLAWRPACHALALKDGMQLSVALPDAQTPWADMTPAISPADAGPRAEGPARAVLQQSAPTAPAVLAAVELVDRPEIWVSSARIDATIQGDRAVVEMVGPTARPFDWDPGSVRLTVVTPDGAVETLGCEPRG